MKKSIKLPPRPADQTDKSNRRNHSTPRPETVNRRYQQNPQIPTENQPHSIRSISNNHKSIPCRKKNSSKKKVSPTKYKTVTPKIHKILLNPNLNPQISPSSANNHLNVIKKISLYTDYLYPSSTVYKFSFVCKKAIPRCVPLT